MTATTTRAACRASTFALGACAILTPLAILVAVVLFCGWAHALDAHANPTLQAEAAPLGVSLLAAVAVSVASVWGLIREATR